MAKRQYSGLLSPRAEREFLENQRIRLEQCGNGHDDDGILEKHTIGGSGEVYYASRCRRCRCLLIKKGAREDD